MLFNIEQDALQQTEHRAPTSGSKAQLHSEPPQMKIADDLRQKHLDMKDY